MQANSFRSALSRASNDHSMKQLTALNFSYKRLLSAVRLCNEFGVEIILQTRTAKPVWADSRSNWNCKHFVCLFRSGTEQILNKSYSHIRHSYYIPERTFCQHSQSIMPPHPTIFRFSDYDIVGFDLDCTLLRYNLNEMVPLEYELLRKFLVEEKGYPRALMDKTIDRNFFQKGLVLDADNGNILKLGADATILRAAHGTTLMTPQQIVDIYGADRQWTISTQFFQEPLSTWNGPLSEKLRTLLDYFDVAVSLVFAQAIEVLDAERGGKPQQQAYKVWPDLLEGLIQMYSRENFTNGRSGYFEALQAHPERYLLRTNNDVILWLQKMRAAGKALFLLTGSNIDFANFTATYALGPEWQKLFDCVVCYAKKPGYFTAQRPYLRVDNLTELLDSEISQTTMLPLNCTYSQGNWIQLRAALAGKLGKDPATVRSLYVGDNLIQDVYSPVKHHDLETVAVCEELLTEDGSAYNYGFNDVVASTIWGSYFCVDNKPTLWAAIIAKYSQLCIPLMDTVAGTSVTHTYSTKGYFPKTPKALLP